MLVYLSLHPCICFYYIFSYYETVLLPLLVVKENVLDTIVREKFACSLVVERSLMFVLSGEENFTSIFLLLKLQLLERKYHSNRNINNGMPQLGQEINIFLPMHFSFEFNNLIQNIDIVMYTCRHYYVYIYKALSKPRLRKTTFVN